MWRRVAQGIDGRLGGQDQVQGGAVLLGKRSSALTTVGSASRSVSGSSLKPKGIQASPNSRARRRERRVRPPTQMASARSSPDGSTMKSW